MNSIILRDGITRFICIYISNIFCQAQLCMNEYFATNSLYTKENNFVPPYYLASTTDEVERPWCLSSHGEFLGIWRSNFSIFLSAWRSLAREQRVVITELNLDYPVLSRDPVTGIAMVYFYPPLCPGMFLQDFLWEKDENRPFFNLPTLIKITS